MNQKVAPQFDDFQQQDESASLAMWIFLATEVLFFGGLFLAYCVYRFTYPDGFLIASKELNATLATVNTFLLLTSSFLMAIAVKAAKEGVFKKAGWALLGTFSLGALFLVVKAFEYHEDFQKGLYAGERISLEGTPGVAIFYSLYYVMTGLHAVHLTVGICIILYFSIRSFQTTSSKNQISSTQIEVLGLYWHFVDLVWVFLYPLLYLIGRQSK